MLALAASRAWTHRIKSADNLRQLGHAIHGSHCVLGAMAWAPPPWAEFSLQTLADLRDRVPLGSRLALIGLYCILISVWSRGVVDRRCTLLLTIDQPMLGDGMFLLIRTLPPALGKSRRFEPANAVMLAVQQPAQKDPCSNQGSCNI